MSTGHTDQHVWQLFDWFDANRPEGWFAFDHAFERIHRQSAYNVQWRLRELMRGGKLGISAGVTISSVRSLSRSQQRSLSRTSFRDSLLRNVGQRGYLLMPQTPGSSGKVSFEFQKPLSNSADALETRASNRSLCLDAFVPTTVPAAAQSSWSAIRSDLDDDDSSQLVLELGHRFRDLKDGMSAHFVGLNFRREDASPDCRWKLLFAVTACCDGLDTIVLTSIRKDVRANERLQLEKCLKGAGFRPSSSIPGSDEWFHGAFFRRIHSIDAVTSEVDWLSRFTPGL